MADRRFLTIYWRDMLRYVRFRALLFSSLVQPALWLAFFGIAMSSSFDAIGAQIPPVPGVPTVGYLTYMCAGVIAMTTLFTSLFGGMSLLFDKNWGLLREVMAAPMSRANIVLGTGLSGITKSCIQAVIILVFGLLLGVQFFAGYDPLRIVIAIAGILLFVSVFALGFVFLSSAIALTMESPEGMQGVMTLLTMPIFFASNALYPVQAFPPVLQAVARRQPAHAPGDRDPLLRDRPRVLGDRPDLLLHGHRPRDLVRRALPLRRHHLRARPLPGPERARDLGRAPRGPRRRPRSGAR